MNYVFSAPQKPSRDAFLLPNGTSIGLNFSTWLDGGCPKTDFIVEYKLKDAVEWQKIEHDSSTNQQFVLITGLILNNIYTIRVLAKNDAGYTSAEYDISTSGEGLGKCIIFITFINRCVGK